MYPPLIHRVILAGQPLVQLHMILVVLRTLTQVELVLLLLYLIRLPRLLLHITLQEQQFLILVELLRI